MTLELRLRAEAELDLADAALWYETQSTGLGHQFLGEVLAAFASIAKCRWPARLSTETRGAS